MIKKIRKIIYNNYTRKKAYLILLCCYILAFYKFISSTYLFYDDQGRKYAGYHGWLDWSRWTNTLLSNLVHTDYFLYDISPLTQIFSCVLLAYVSILLVDIFYNKEKYNLLGILATISIGVNPYFLRCFECKYDILYMVISILVSVFPIYYWKSNKDKNEKMFFKYSIVSIICLLIMLTSYQSSAGIYPMLVVIVVLKELFDYDDIKSNLMFVVSSIGSYLLSILFFLKVLLLNRSDSGTWSTVSDVGDVINNYFEHYREILLDFKTIWLMLIATMLLLYIFLYTFYYSGKKIRGFIYALSGIFLISFMAFGANLFISGKNMLEANYLYGAMIGISFISTHLVYIFLKANNCKKIFVNILNIIAVVSAIALFYCFFVFNYIYGNVLVEQWRYHDFRVQEVVNDLSELEIMQTDEIKTVKIIGNIGLSPVNRNISDTKLLEKLLPSSFSGDDIWGEFYFRYYFDLPNIIEEEQEDDDIDISKYILLEQTSYHKIYLRGNKIIIELDNPNQIEWETQ